MNFVRLSRPDGAFLACAVCFLGCATDPEMRGFGADQSSLDSPGSGVLDLPAADDGAWVPSFEGDPRMLAQIPESAPALASGCDAAHPTFIGGTISGSDGRALNAIIGVDHADATGQKIDANGVACGAAGNECCAGYSWCVRVNPTIAPEGSTDANLTRTWGRCVTPKVREAFFEMYPKNSAGMTDFARYGEAVHAHQPIAAGATNTIGLRLPTTFDAAGGNTGGIQGYIWCGSEPAPPAAVTRVRAWSDGVGSDCGIEGFNASATALGTGGSGTTYYKIAYLEGGRCFAPSQEYRFYMDVTCGGVKQTLKKIVNVKAATYPRVDWQF